MLLVLAVDVNAPLRAVQVNTLEFTRTRTPFLHAHRIDAECALRWLHTLLLIRDYRLVIVFSGSTCAHFCSFCLTRNINLLLQHIAG